MLQRLRRFLDVRPGEGLSVLLSFLYIAAVVASFLLAKPIRNGLFLKQYGPYSLVYVYAAVPIALTLFVPLYTRAVARIGTRLVTVVTLLFFAANVLFFWYAFRFHPFELLPAIFFVWVNCFGIIAPVQAWSFANSLFDTRQAKRLFGLIGAGASFGAITGGLMARYLVEPVGGAVNMLLVLAALILLGRRDRVDREHAHPAQGRHAPDARRAATRSAMRCGRSRRSPYLRLMAALVFLVAIVDAVDRVSAEPRGRRAVCRRRRRAHAVLRHVQLHARRDQLPAAAARHRPGAAPLRHRRHRAHPAALARIRHGAHLAGARALVGARHERVRSGLPLLGRQGELRAALSPDSAGAAHPGQERDRHRRQPRRRRLRRAAPGPGDAGVLRVDSRPRPRPARHGGDQPGVHRDLGGPSRGGCATEYVRTIHESIHRHRLDTERAASTTIEKSAAEALRAKLAGGDASEVRYALGLLEVQQTRSWQPALRTLLQHPEGDIRRRALSLLRAAGDREIGAKAVELLKDPRPRRPHRGAPLSDARDARRPAVADSEARRLRGFLDSRRDGGVPGLAGAGAEPRRGAGAARGDGRGQRARKARASAPRPRA